MTRPKATPRPKQETRSFKLLSQPIEVRTAPDGSRSITGIAAPFSKRSVDLDGFTEIIAPGAFKRTLVESPDVLFCRDHNISILYGRTKSGTLTLSEVPAGLQFRCLLPQTTEAANLVVQLERGDIDSCSFQFRCVKDDWKVAPDGTLLRTLLDVDLIECSVVSLPAYPDATVALRSCPIELRGRLKPDPILDDDDTDDPSEDDEDSDDDEERCACPCQECQDGDCTECTEDCDEDENDDCQGCPSLDDTRADKLRIRSLFQSRHKFSSVK